MMGKEQRNMAIDMMKGIGILLMMMCHLVYTEGPVRQLVYSFHMPLFFIISGLFAKDIPNIASFRQFTIKNARRLLLPYIATMIMLCVWGGIQAIAKHNISYFMRRILSMLYASADAIDSQWGLIYAGPMWFLIALFVVRELFGVLQLMLNNYKFKYLEELILSLSALLSISAVLMRTYLPPLPFCITQALVALSFYAIGWYIHQYSMPWWGYGLCVVVWPFAIIYGSVELESSYLSYYPLSFIGACGGTYAVYLFCNGIIKLRSYIIRNTPNIICKASCISEPLTWCGIYSLPILCMHEFEMYSDIMYSLRCRISFACFMMGWGEIVIAILLTIILFHIPYLKEVYK